MAGLLAWLQTSRLTSPEPARRANARMNLARMIEHCRLCLAIREDDGVIDKEIADRLRGSLDKADRARTMRNQLLHSSTVIIDEADSETQGSIDFVGDHAVVATLVELESAGQVIDDAGSNIYLARQVAEYQMGLRRTG
jgi:hypothetical protein